jgi:hypothetical protein
MQRRTKVTLTSRKPIAVPTGELMGARIRTIKPEFWGDEKIGSLPRLARLTFLGLISAAADDLGRCRGNPRAVRSALYPLDDDVLVEEIVLHLELLAGLGLIRLYTVNSEPYLLVVNFTRHQKIDRPSASQLPPPPDDLDHALPFVNTSSNDRRAVAEYSTSPRSVKESSGEESNGKERSGRKYKPKEAKAKKGAPVRGDPTDSDSEERSMPEASSFSKELCDRLYEAWLQTGHGVEYSWFRKALKPLYPSNGPRYEEDEMTAAIIAFNEAADGVSADKSQFWHVQKFVQHIGRWIEVGAMPLADGNGLTERGRAAVGGL